MVGNRSVGAGLGLVVFSLLGLAVFGDEPATPLKLTGWPRKLSWDDFRVVEDTPDHRQDRDAGFYSAFEVTDFEYRRTAPGVFQVRSVTIRVAIDDNRWVRRGRQSDALLAHEQGHFDITGLAVHNLSRTLRTLRADSVDGLREKGKQAIREQTAVCERWNREYDAATNHGLNRKAQRQWSDRIALAIEADHASLDDTPEKTRPARPETPNPEKPTPPRRKGR